MLVKKKVLLTARPSLPGCNFRPFAVHLREESGFIFPIVSLYIVENTD